MSLLAAAAQDEDHDKILELRAYIKRLKQKQLAVGHLIKVNANNTAAVAQDFYWIPVEQTPPPLGVKLLLINQKLGVACMGDYNKNQGWTHWQGLPKFKSN